MSPFHACPPSCTRTETHKGDGDVYQEESGVTDVTGVIDAMHAPCETELAHAHVLQIITHPDPSFLSGKSDVHAHTHTLMYVYVYIYIDRERESLSGKSDVHAHTHTH